MTDFEKIVKLLTEHFKDQEKVIGWLVTPNPNLGGASPTILISQGRSSKVLAFIENSLDENKKD